jgi:putative membrane protein
MTMMWGDGGWGWIGGSLMMLVFWGGLVVLMVFVVRGGMHRSDREGQAKHRDAEDILAERFARGEMSEEEFEQRKQVLTRQRG